ncbi:RNA polymerase II-associated protein [Trichinella pseudospiralis]
MLAYNSSVNESTGVTPAMAMFGRELQLPLDIQMGSPQRNDTETLPNYIRQTRERINIVHEQMRRQLNLQQRRQKSLYDRKATQGTFREGPYEIVQTLGPHTYRVRHQERRRRTMVVHSDRLKKYVTQEDADETRRRPFPLWYGSGNYPKEQQPKENVTGPSVEVRRSMRTRRPPGIGIHKRTQRTWITDNLPLRSENKEKFLPLYEVPAAEDLPDRNVTGSVASQLCLLENT